MMFCEKCGTSNPQYAAFCRTCGNKITAAGTQSIAIATNTHSQNQPIKVEESNLELVRRLIMSVLAAGLLSLAFYLNVTTHDGGFAYLTGLTIGQSFVPLLVVAIFYKIRRARTISAAGLLTA